MTSYNGHRSWNAWNVALWISNDEGLYRLALDCKANHKRLAAAVTAFLDAVGEGSKTPDGAVYNRTCVTEALRGLE